MKRILISANFYLDELIDPLTYFTMDDHGLSLIDPKIIDCLQLLRTLKGSSISVNNWWKHHSVINKSIEEIELVKFQKWINSNHSVHQWSGYRSKYCKIGAKMSKHRFGQAVDPKGDESEMFNLVLENARIFYGLGLRRLEDISITNGWLHMDTSESNHSPGKIRIVDRSSHTGDITI